MGRVGAGSGSPGSADGPPPRRRVFGARWLLQTPDRVESDTFPLTQEFLAQMLGCAPAGAQSSGGHVGEGRFIQLTPGQIAIVDRKGLDAASRSRHRTVRDQ